MRQIAPKEKKTKKVGADKKKSLLTKIAQKMFQFSSFCLDFISLLDLPYAK